MAVKGAASGQVTPQRCHFDADGKRPWFAFPRISCSGGMTSIMPRCVHHACTRQLCVQGFRVRHSAHQSAGWASGSAIARRCCSGAGGAMRAGRVPRGRSLDAQTSRPLPPPPAWATQHEGETLPTKRHSLLNSSTMRDIQSTLLACGSGFTLRVKRNTLLQGWRGPWNVLQYFSQAAVLPRRFDESE